MPGRTVRDLSLHLVGLTRHPMSFTQPASKRQTDTWSEKELASQLKQVHQLDRRGGRRPEAQGSTQQVTGTGRARQSGSSTKKEGAERVQHERRKDKLVKQPQDKVERPAAVSSKEREKVNRSERGKNSKHHPGTVKGNGVPSDLRSTSQSFVHREGGAPPHVTTHTSPGDTGKRNKVRPQLSLHH